MQVQTLYHVRKLISRLFLCDTWSRYLSKWLFMHSETRQISNLRSQEVSKGILSDLVRKDAGEFKDKFNHIQYATLEMFKGTFNNYSVLKMRFFINTHTFEIYCKNVSHQYYATNQDKPHIFLCSCPKIGVDPCLYFFRPSFYYAAFFPLKGKLNIIYFPYKICNDNI